MTSNPWDDVKLLFDKREEISDKAQFYMINRILSFHGGTLGLSNRLDKYIYTVDGDIIKKIMDTEIPRQKVPFFHYIKKPEEKKSEKYDEVVQQIRQFFHWTDKEYGIMLPLLDKLLEDENKLREALEFFGCERSLYKKYEIEFDEKEVSECQSLKKWQ